MDRKSQTLTKGCLYVFTVPKATRIFKEGTLMLKKLVAIPQDEIAIHKENFSITVNGNSVASGLPLAKKFQQSETTFCGSKKLSTDEYWFLGEHPSSFDSRYWGSVRKDEIIGKAWPIF